LVSFSWENRKILDAGKPTRPSGFRRLSNGHDVRIAVIIVNWNSGSLLKKCLEALARQRRQPDRVIVVDNASADDSLRQAEPALGNAHVIRLNENAGFAEANNRGVEAASGFDALVLLNPDAFPEPGWLEQLVAAAEREPDFDLFASQLLLESDSRFLDGAGDSYHVSGRAWRNGHGKLATTWSPDSFEVFAPCAAAALYRREAFERVAGFDESYFCYFEDVDLAFRLRLMGCRCLYVPTAVVRHVSSGLAGYRSDFAVYHGERNMVWTFVKNMPASLLWRYLPQHLLLNLASLLYYPLRGQGRTVWRAKWDALKGLPGVLRRRREIQDARVATDRAIQKTFRHGLLAPYLRRYS
jgi:GT2 family glycosyltransferase